MSTITAINTSNPSRFFHDCLPPLNSPSFPLETATNIISSKFKIQLKKELILNLFSLFGKRLSPNCAVFHQLAFFKMLLLLLSLTAATRNEERAIVSKRVRARKESLLHS